MNPEEYLTWSKYKMQQLLQRPRPKRVPCTCSICLRRKGVTIDGKKQYICDYKSCNKHFPKLQQLRSHMRSHLGERPYSCSFCEKRFFRHEELTRHKRSHTKEKIYACPQCNKGFTRSDYLSKHIDMHKRRALEKEQEREATPSLSRPDCNENEKNYLTDADNNNKDNDENDDNNELNKSTEDI